MIIVTAKPNKETIVSIIKETIFPIFELGVFQKYKPLKAIPSREKNIKNVNNNGIIFSKIDNWANSLIFILKIYTIYFQNLKHSSNKD